MIVRVLDPARAQFYATKGLQHRLPDVVGDRDARLRGPCHAEDEVPA